MTGLGNQNAKRDPRQAQTTAGARAHAAIMPPFGAPWVRCCVRARSDALPATCYRCHRREYPDGRYEAGADIADDEWIRLKLDIDETRVGVSLNGKEEFAPTDLKAIPEADGIGLWVGRGTEGYFSSLRITPR